MSNNHVHSQETPFPGEPTFCRYCDAVLKKGVWNEPIPYEEYIKEYTDKGWRKETCGVCNGYGVVSHYSSEDFLGAKDCDSCCGGFVWITPKGKHVMWPGGPFC